MGGLAWAKAKRDDYWRTWFTARQRKAFWKWFLFVLALGCSPILFAFVLRLLNIGAKTPHPLRDGGLLIVNTIVGGTGIGDLLGGSRWRQSAPMMAGALALVTAGLSILIYGVVVVQKGIGSHKVAIASLLLFFGAAIAGAACVLIGEEEGPQPPPESSGSDLAG